MVRRQGCRNPGKGVGGSCTPHPQFLTHHLTTCPTGFSDFLTALDIVQGRRNREKQGRQIPPPRDFGRNRSKTLSFKMQISDLPTALYHKNLNVLLQTLESGFFFSDVFKFEFFSTFLGSKFIQGPTFFLFD